MLAGISFDGGEHDLRGSVGLEPEDMVSPTIRESLKLNLQTELILVEDFDGFLAGCVQSTSRA